LGTYCDREKVTSKEGRRESPNRKMTKGGAGRQPKGLKANKGSTAQKSRTYGGKTWPKEKQRRGTKGGLYNAWSSQPCAVRKRGGATEQTTRDEARGEKNQKNLVVKVQQIKNNQA